MGKIDAIIYDVDGTLLNTMRWILGAFEHTAKKHGYELNRDQLRPLIGLSMQSIYETLCPGLDFARAYEAHSDFQRNNIELISPYPDTKELLETHKDKEQAIVTSRIGNLELTLKNAGIAGYFETVVTANDVDNHKPHPEGLHLALAMLDVEPARAVYVGDGTMDMEAAKRAHMTAIGITHGFGPEKELRRFGADHIVHGHKELKELLSELS